MERVIVAAIGAPARGYEFREYQFSGKVCKTKFSTVALSVMMNEPPTRALILVTEGARANYEVLAAELAERGVAPQPINIPIGQNRDEILRIVQLLIDSISSDAKVYLDVTLGLRHLPFVYLAALSYLVGLQHVSIEGIFYGASEAVEGNAPVPLLDITELFGLLEWYHALQTAHNTGNYKPLVRQFCLDTGVIAKRLQSNKAQPNSALASLKKPLEQLSHAVSAGLPIEVGMHADTIIHRFSKLDTNEQDSLVLRLAVDSLRENLQLWAVSGPKSAVRLTEHELARQLVLIEWYAELGDEPKCLLLLREWLVSFARYRAGAGESNWLNHDERTVFERYLASMENRKKADLSPGADDSLIAIWSKVRTRRNNYAHPGMTEEEITPRPESCVEMVKTCRALMTSSPVELQKPVPHHVVVTPLGFSPGVLYSAVRSFSSSPCTLVIVTSDIAKSKIAEALSAADVRIPAERLVQCIMNDPYNGFDEADRFICADLLSKFVAATEVTVNITGGTTAMQYIVEKLAKEAESLGVRVKRVALIDKRSRDEQEENPYVLGESRVLSVTSAFTT